MLTRIRPLAIVALLFAAGCSEAPEERDQAQVVDPPAAPSFNDMCAIEDPALLQVPDHCFPVDGAVTVTTYPGGNTVTSRSLASESCLVTSDGRVYGNDLDPTKVRFPACPMGIFWRLPGVHEPAEHFERAISVLKGGQYYSASQRETLEVVPRTVEVLPGQEAVFVRLDPRPASGRTLEVTLDYRELFPEIEIREGEHFAFGLVFVVGQ
jgi:hypothetical protein